MVFPGWVVSRAIPPEVWFGLMSGQYKMYGGVIRWAAGTKNAGQIVRHLLPIASSQLSILPGLGFIPGIVSSVAANVQIHALQKTTDEIKKATLFNTYQLAQMSGQINSLSQATQQVLQAATGAAVLSGLGLTVSCIGFTAINSKLNTIDGRLKEVQKDVKAIKYFLESSERARLFAALNALLKIDAKTSPEHRHSILHHSRNTLAEINMRYRELLSEANTIETAMANEEYYSLTALAQVRCTAELGMLNIAAKEMEEMNEVWQTQAHRVAQEVLIGDHPERFLATDFVDDVSIADLAQWLDFVYDEQKGLGWIDELRRKLNEDWYSKGWFSGGGSGLNKNVGLGLEKEQQMLLPSLKKLVARSSVFEGYVAQYELLETQQVKPSEFEQQLAALPASASADGNRYLILEPVKTEKLMQSA